jgi:hypothetical protein
VDIPYTYIRGSADSIDYLPMVEFEINIVSPGGPDPGLTIIILILSVAGGVILLGSAYIILKERKIIN